MNKKYQKKLNRRQKRLKNNKYDLLIFDYI